MSLISKFFKNFSVTNWIILANVIFFILALFAPTSIQVVNNQNVTVSPFIDNYIAISYNNLLGGRVWTLLTSMFMHASFEHIFFNMFSLFFIGNFVEKIIGRKKYFWFYILAGLFAGLFFSLLSLLGNNSGILVRIFTQPSTLAVGASGAIFGLLGLLAVLVPKGKVYLIAGPLIALVLEALFQSILPDNVMLVLNLIITLYIFISIFSIFSFNRKIMKISLPIEMPFWILPIIAIVPLVVIGLFINLPIGNTAHLGGLILGLLYGWYLRKKYKKKIILLNRLLARK